MAFPTPCRRASAVLPLLLGALSVAAVSEVAAQGQGVTSPAEGVVCDGAGPVCYDAQGPSIGHTQTYYGRMAAERLTRELAGRPTVQEFRLSNGAVCDTRASLCWSDGYGRRTVAADLSRQLFGSSGGGGGALQAPQAGVICDPAEQTCFDKLGLSLGLTREYYGAYAEQQALRKLGGQPTPKVFRLSNGAVCDVDARRCWSDGWERRTLDARLSRQLFGPGSEGLARQGQCRLTRWFKVLNSGSCTISERGGKTGRELDVTLSNGAVYSFSRRRGEGYQLSDDKGSTWPVRVSDQGSSLSFSWSDRVLQITPQRQQGAGAPSLGQLIDSLLSP